MWKGTFVYEAPQVTDSLDAYFCLSIPVSNYVEWVGTVVSRIELQKPWTN